MLNRHKAPKSNNIKSLNFPPSQNLKLSNGIETFLYKSNNSPVIVLNIIFKSGVDNDTKKLQTFFTNEMLKEAPKGMTSNDTAELFDYYGAFVESFSYYNSSGLRLYVPQKFFKNVLPTFSNLILYPGLPEQEFQILKNKSKEALKTNLLKAKHITARETNNKLFGDHNPRGWFINPKDIDNIYLNDLENYINNFYSPNNCFIQISGDFDKQEIEIFDDVFAKNFSNTKHALLNKKGFVQNTNLLSHIEMPESIQTSIEIAKNLGKLSDKEIIDINILNTVLGGYFGSRLMKNIREDKGYTYGIYSFLTEFDDCTCFKVRTEVGNEYAKNTISEIIKEIEILCSKTIPNSELNLVKNYLKGEMLSSLDGVFKISKVCEKLILTNRNNNIIHEEFNRIQKITPTELKNIAQNYFINNDFFIISSGKQNNA